VADRAARQYHATGPENRLVGRELERRWEAALQEQRWVEDDYKAFLGRHPTRLTAADREAIRLTAADLPARWGAVSTRPEDRKAILRHLIERAIVAVRGESEYVDLTIVWAGGGASQHELVRRVRSLEQLRFRHVNDRGEGPTVPRAPGAASSIRGRRGCNEACDTVSSRRGPRNICEPHRDGR
jgi:hypothetical protein